MNNRAKHFEALQNIRSQMELIIQRNEKFGKHNIFVGQFIDGLKKARKSILNLINYNADDKKYLLYVGDAAVKINILCNRLLKGKLKEEALVLYKNCCNILPVDFQLNLFMVGKEFGWGIDVQELDKPTNKAFRAVQKFIDHWRKHYDLVNAQFSGLWKPLQGKQLTFADCRV
jgi:hypothetical protein